MTNPVKGQVVQSQFGEAVFSGYCWVPASLWSFLTNKPAVDVAEAGDEESADDDTGISEFGACAGCGAHWGNSIKHVVCVHCGRSVPLT